MDLKPLDLLLYPTSIFGKCCFPRIVALPVEIVFSTIKDLDLEDLNILALGALVENFAILEDMLTRLEELVKLVGVRDPINVGVILRITVVSPTS